MTPKEFLDFNNSTSMFDYLTVFPKDSVSGIALAHDTLTFLTQTGIPTYAAPNFYFGDFDGQFLPLLNDWPWRKQQYENDLKAWVVGCAPDESPVCILENEQLFIYKTSQDKQLLNNSLPQLIGVLVAYATMVDKAMSECGDDVFINNTIPEHLIVELEKQLPIIDDGCCANSCFWIKELYRLRRLSEFGEKQK